MALSKAAQHMHVRVSEPLHAGNLYKVIPEFRAMDPSTSQITSDPNASLTSLNFDSSSFIPLHVARNNFSVQPAPPSFLHLSKSDKVGSAHLMDKLAGLDGPRSFDAWVVSCIRIDPKEAYETMNTVDKVSRQSVMRLLVPAHLFQGA